MYSPVLKKLVDRKDTFIERCLPVAGSIFVKEGDPVKPFDRLGECVFSQKQAHYPKNLKPLKYKKSPQFYYAGSVLGKMAKKDITTPFNGYLAREKDGSYVLKAADDKYTLLSGVWGEVHKVVGNRSILIKTKTRDLLLVASTSVNSSGELVVFPNPLEILEKYYLESFSKNNAGKVIYVGHYADLEVVKRAGDMGVAAIIAGSASRETFNYAKEKGIALGIISGFGRPETPGQIFNLLSVIAYRYVFFEGERGILRIPHSTSDTQKGRESVEERGTSSKKAVVRKKVSAKSSIIKKVEKGVDVVCLQPPHYGKIGTVDSVSGTSIFVKFSIEKNSTEIKVPNFFIIE